QTLYGYASRGDTYGGWGFFAYFGGRFAGNAAAIFGKGGNLNGFYFWMKKRGGKLLGDTGLSLLHISEPTRRAPISYAGLCFKKKKEIPFPAVPDHRSDLA
ncbi:hypothetical protein, partial [Neisseria meningitidis]|uniref:hypothetical protein n=1 Tax=Neisseria meningitidis TaxID=487 RepID=UPI001C99FA51